MKGALSRMRHMVQLVADLVFDDDGNATCTAVSDDQEDDKLDPTVAYHFGFYSRPKDGARGVVLKADGQGNTSFLIGFRDKQYEISLSKGEVGIQNAFSASILLDKSGNIIETPGGAGTVQLGGNTYSLPRLETLLGDINTLANALATWVPLVVTAVAAAPSGVATDPGVVAALSTIISGISGGTYKSTKAKNG